jgi:hypothetical protein
VVGQGTGSTGDGNAGVAAAIQQPPGYLLCRKPLLAAHTAVFVESGSDTGLRPHAQQQAGQNQKHCPIKIEQAENLPDPSMQGKETIAPAFTIIHGFGRITTGNV